MTKTIFLVDDDEAIRHASSFMLRQAGYTVKTFPDGITFLDGHEPADPACILLDVRMPGMDGLSVQKVLNQRGNAMPVIVLTGHGDVSVAVEAMKNGAVEFLEKPYEKRALIDAIESAFNRIADERSRDRQVAMATAQLSLLTAREDDVLNCLVAGMTNKAIAEHLDISPRTVEIHRANVMTKLDAESLSAALRIAFLAGRGK